MGLETYCVWVDMLYNYDHQVPQCVGQKIEEELIMKMRKGFTLVELLIVIVIIGILAAAMLLSSGSATASAEASNIVSDLRNMKAAVLMFYADSMDAVNAATFDVNTVFAGATDVRELLGRYVDNPEKYSNGLYFVRGTGGAGEQRWYVGYDATGAVQDVKDKLKGKANTTGLLGSTSNTLGATPTAYNGENFVWMAAR